MSRSGSGQWQGSIWINEHREAWFRERENVRVAAIDREHLITTGSLAAAYVVVGLNKLIFVYVAVAEL